MLCSKTANNKIITVHKRASRLKNQQNLNMLANPSIHSKNICYLLNEIFQSLNKNNPKFMWNIWGKKTFIKTFGIKTLLKYPNPKQKRLALSP